MTMSFTESKLHSGLAPIVGYIIVSDLDTQHTTVEVIKSHRPKLFVLYAVDKAIKWLQSSCFLFCYVHAQDQFVFINNAAISLYDIVEMMFQTLDSVRPWG